MKTKVAPFKTSPDSAVRHAGWHLVTNEGEEPLGEDVRAWDYQTTLTVSAAVSIEREELLRRCELHDASDLRVIVLAKSDHTNARGVVASVEVPHQARYDLAVTAVLPGHSLGGRLDLVTQLVALSPVGETPLSAQRRGSILWQTRHRTHLEGAGSRFPTDAADFAVVRPQLKNAAWFLQVDTTDPELSFMSAVRLTLNSGLGEVQRLLAGSGDADVKLLMRTIRWDVTRQLIDAALDWDAIEDSPADFDATTVSGVLRSLLAQVWPHESPSLLRHRRSDDRQLFETEIQHFARFGA